MTHLGRKEAEERIWKMQFCPRNTHTDHNLTGKVRIGIKQCADDSLFVNLPPS